MLHVANPNEQKKPIILKVSLKHCPEQYTFMILSVYAESEYGFNETPKIN